MKLSDLKINQKAIIKNINISNLQLKRHLMELGVITGTNIKVVNIAPMGDPISIELRGYELGIRKSEAKNIIVEVI